MKFGSVQTSSGLLKVLLTSLMTSHDRLGGSARVSRTSFINSCHTELVTRTVVKILYRECCVGSRVVVALEPFTSPFTLFDIVT